METFSIFTVLFIGWLYGKLPGTLASDPAFLESVSVIGLHYPCNHAPEPQIFELGLKFWSSEGESVVAPLYTPQHIQHRLTVDIDLICNVY